MAALAATDNVFERPNDIDNNSTGSANDYDHNGLSTECIECASNSFTPSATPVDDSINHDVGGKSKIFDLTLDGTSNDGPVILFLASIGLVALSIVYAIVVFVSLRMRSYGYLDVYNDDFGRVYCWNRRCFIPFGWFVRRFVLTERAEPAVDGVVRFMTREERRTAVERLIRRAGGEDGGNGNGNDEHPFRGENDGDDDKHHEERSDRIATEGDDALIQSNDASDVGDQSNTQPVCCICLGEYGTFECLLFSLEWMDGWMDGWIGGCGVG